MSKQPLILLGLPIAFQADDERSIPFTRSKCIDAFNHASRVRNPAGLPTGKSRAGKDDRSKSDGRKRMVDSGRDVAVRSFLSRSANRTCRLVSTAPLALGIGARNQSANTAAAQSSPPPEEEYGEFLARPEELASVAVNDIVKSIRLNATAMTLGRSVYDKHCAS
jgi:hypothetical protein